jgi:hypothetical protein
MQQIKILEARIERLEKQVSKKREKQGGWVNGVIIPLLDWFENETGAESYEKYGPCGLDSQISAYFHYKDGTRIHFVIAPGDIEEGDYYLVIDIDLGKYPEGSLGEINGFNSLHVRIPDNADIMWFYRWVNIIRPLETDEEEI